MYIQEFWCGYILGVITAIILIIAWAIWYTRRNK